MSARPIKPKSGVIEACSDINLDIKQSEFVAIVGPSGCGKTTILKMVAGLMPYTSGTITVGGKRVDRPQTDVGIVFQEAIMLDWRDVLANVMLQIDIRKHGSRQVRSRSRVDLLKATGSRDSRTRSPTSCPAACGSVFRSAARWCMTRAC